MVQRAQCGWSAQDGAAGGRAGCAGTGEHTCTRGAAGAGRALRWAGLRSEEQ